MLTNILTIYFFVGIFLYVGGIQTPFTALITGTASWDNAVSMLINDQNIGLAAAAIVASLIFSGGGVIYILLVPLVVVMLSFVTYPASVFNAGGLPPELLASDTSGTLGFFQLIYWALTFFTVLAIVNWWKGSD